MMMVDSESVMMIMKMKTWVTKCVTAESFDDDHDYYNDTVRMR